jgi:hypothetical protein
LARDDPIREHFTAVGVVASEWADLETLVDLSSIELCRLPPHLGMCLTAQISGINRKLEAYISIARLHVEGSSVIADLTKFHSSTMSLAERRNRIIHDPWDVDITGRARRYEITARKRLRAEYIEMTTEEVHKCAADIRIAQDAFMKLHEQIKIRAFS